ncbi:Mur ligase family protein [Thermophilibacter provencensis]|uniref:UDP-N-acetylmuramoyl-L-alanyl-D-glutamate--2, 6-diaminopimelate ligase n=1 Tax=Thermophilibacter provencensis TaxID=1852386 RepID=A0ABT7V6N7_9ACTN|nr:UDP-N-acetylmuramoyl-L-alanyl-D-glutamate--2,6-diaminopimelate ligase [Thermophilibacter provencensis]MDM8271629.1 UDP-N-acetylmuramoyl-L-alanyl-D-glutamate--2,6-diaminopimelate ligase [Thermophilibacter provencensis]
MNTTNLASLAALLEEQGLLAGTHNLTAEAGATPVTGADCDSRVVRAGHVFVCKGAAFKPAYLTSALEKGAVAFLCDEAHAGELTTAAPGVPALVASNLRRAMALVSAEAFGHPDNDVRVVGITGTKGKSTVSYMLRAVLDGDEPGSGTGVIGSIDTYDGVENLESHNTTPESPDLWRHIANTREAGLPFLDMEVSSQGLKYDRVLGLTLEVACFLNIGRDHISPVEHPDFEDYFESKLLIFDQARSAVINMDCDQADVVSRRAEKCARVLRFSAEGREGADVWATDVRSALGRVSFTAHTPSWEGEVTLAMPGLFNVDNALATIAICELLGIGRERIVPALARATVPGRMELLGDLGARVVALVDYAHNKLSYQRFFPSVKKEFPGYRIIALFGAPGGKAYERRTELPQEAAKWSDYLIYTEEDPAHDPVEEICAQMAAATPEGTPYEVICDREEAVRRSVELAYEGEGPAIVCLLAKGDETRQHEGDEFVPCRTDGEIFLEAAQKYEA